MNTPILITMPRYAANNGNTLSEMLKDQDMQTQQRGKKRRLEHLTWEEKIQRKKLKNRVAAQTSRDRKKARMDELEMSLEVLKAQNDKLISECRSLRQLNERLLAENSEMKKQKSSSQVCSVCCGSATGPAVSAPLQQEREAQQAAALWWVIIYLLYQTSLMKSSQISTSVNLKNLPKVSSKTLLETIKQLMKSHVARASASVPKNIVVQKWWGRHQNTWNPVETIA